MLRTIFSSTCTEPSLFIKLVDEIARRKEGAQMYQKLVQTDQGYELHQLLSDLDEYKRKKIPKRIPKTFTTVIQLSNDRMGQINTHCNACV